MSFFLLFAAGLAAELPPNARVFIDKNGAGCHRGPNGLAAFDLSTPPFQLEAIDVWHMKPLAELLGKLKGLQEGGESLLDRSMGTPNNRPVLLAGGGFKHGRRMGIETDKFVSATGAVRGLEMV